MKLGSMFEKCIGVHFNKLELDIATAYFHAGLWYSLVLDFLLCTGRMN